VLDKISIILCKTSHPGNIGSVARAMKNMGLTNLRLVAPLQFPHPKALELASGADDLLNRAQVFDTLEEALADCQWLYGTSSRQRVHPWPQVTVKEAVPGIMEAISNNQTIGILFGPERTGLSNEALQRCDFHLTIPSNPLYASLNLAQAVQILSYEIYQMTEEAHSMKPSDLSEKATASEIAGLVEHCKKVALSLGFMDPTHPKKLMPRLQRLIAKSQLEKEEINILRGFLRLIES
jgi:tRNA (cytidine32/uridine32-2'-O)-methyltransferase